jgi:hypothetical protein
MAKQIIQKSFCNRWALSGVGCGKAFCFFIKIVMIYKKTTEEHAERSSDRKNETRTVKTTVYYFGIPVSCRKHIYKAINSLCD